MKTERLRACLALWTVWAAAAAAADAPKTRDAGHLMVAVYKDFAPFARDAKGIDADVGKALAAKLGLAADVQEYAAGDDIDDDLRNIVWRGHHLWRGKLADVMMHVPVDAGVIGKNEEVRIFAPYYRERLVIARNGTRIPNLPTLQIFTSEKIAVERDTLEDRYLVSSFAGLLRENVVHVRTIEEGVAALLRGEVAAVIGRQTLVEAALGNRAAEFQIGPPPAPGLSKLGWDVGLAVKADNPALAEALGAAMSGLLEDGTIARIFKGHGVSHAPPENSAPQTDAARGASLPPAPPAGTGAAPLTAPAQEGSTPPGTAAPGATSGDPAGSPDKASSAAPAPPLGEEIVVTATRSARPIRDAPAAVTVIPRDAIERSPTKTTDELLRDDPSFALFRRSSSMAADPSSQGVNLRGIGPSGVSRSLVLVDGIGANDAFGGWVYWRSMPRIGIDRIEVVPGGGSALYGNYALGGVTQVFSRPITAHTVNGTAEYGSFDDYQLGLRATDRRGPVGAAVEVEMLKSRGYPVVAPASRGPIDGDTPSKDAAVNARVETAVSPDLKLTARGGYFYEDQNGGTQYTTAGAKRYEYGVGAHYTPGQVGAVELSLFGHSAEFTQSRARIDAQRTTEAQAASQVVPAHDVGAALVWTSRPLELAGRHTLMIGSDGRRITGTTHEDLMPPTVTSTTVVHRDAGGAQWLYGVFAQDMYDISRWVALQLALRYDGWVNTDASRTDWTTAGPTTTPFARRSDDQLSPKLGIVVRPLDRLTLRASAYRAFRAPTLNELYRPFQVGTVRTDANENLGPEKLVGGEAGFEVTPLPGLATRVTGFWNQIEDPITNVTISTNVRRRENLGEARVRGVEASTAWQFARVWRASAAYTYVDSKVTDAPGQPQLVGKDLPQDPRHRATASLTFDDPRLVTATVQVRYLGFQYEDDLNTARMGEYMVVDVSVARAITPNVDAVLAVENLFDKQYVVGLAGVETIGQPRFIHGGLRFRL